MEINTTTSTTSAPKPPKRLRFDLPGRVLAGTFTQINIAPPPIPESALNRLYYANINGQDVYMKLYDTTRLLFEDITNAQVIRATGQPYYDWRMQWMALHPKTTPKTKMCIYHFKIHP